MLKLQRIAMLSLSFILCNSYDSAWPANELCWPVQISFKCLQSSGKIHFRAEAGEGLSRLRTNAKKTKKLPIGRTGMELMKISRYLFNWCAKRWRTVNCHRRQLHRKAGHTSTVISFLMVVSRRLWVGSISSVQIVSFGNNSLA